MTSSMIDVTVTVRSARASRRIPLLPVTLSLVTDLHSWSGASNSLVRHCQKWCLHKLVRAVLPVMSLPKGETMFAHKLHATLG
jgi:hypothetical protein